MGFVLQKPCCCPGTVADNIAFDRPRATEGPNLEQHSWPTRRLHRRMSHAVTHDRRTAAPPCPRPTPTIGIARALIRRQLPSLISITHRRPDAESKKHSSSTPSTAPPTPHRLARRPPPQAPAQRQHDRRHQRRRPSPQRGLIANYAPQRVYAEMHRMQFGDCHTISSPSSPGFV